MRLPACSEVTTLSGLRCHQVGWGDWLC